MRVLDVLALAGGALRAHRRRTLSSLAGVTIGVAAVLVLTGLGESARHYVRAQFEVIGTDVVAVLPGKVETTGGIPGFGGVPNDLTIADAEALRHGVPQAAAVAPVSLGNESVSYRDRSRRVLVFGSTAEILPIRRLELRAGAFLPEGPWDRGTGVAVIGSKLVDELFPGEHPLGAIVTIGGWRMRVIGVLQPQGVNFGIDLDETVFLPVSTAMRMFDTSSLFRIVLQARPGFDTDTIEGRATAILRERHGEEDFTITTPEAILGSLEAILTVLTLALAGIASISLAVAGIGIMNVMLVSVSERTPEVGLLKAIGAEPGQVLALFLTEAAALSTAGGVAGIALGAGALRVGGVFLPDIVTGPPAWAPWAALAVALGVGVTFGLWPAIRAVRLEAVDALERRGR